MKNRYCRLNLSLKEFEVLNSYVSSIIDDIKYKDEEYSEDAREDIEILNNILKYVKHIKVSNKKFKAPQKANLTKISKSRSEIEKAYKDLKSENKKITIYSVAKEAGVAHQTAAKHIDIFEEGLV